LPENRSGIFRVAERVLQKNAPLGDVINKK
jgi:hypothetical protein